MREYSTTFGAENYFLISSDILAELRKELKSKIRLKTASTHKQGTYGEIEKHPEQIQPLKKNLKTHVNSFN